jgi:hypothetical protein
VLFNLDRKPVAREHVVLVAWLRSHRVNFPINSHVPDLNRVRNAAQGNDRPVLKLERRKLSQFCDGPWQVANDKSATQPPQLFIFAHIAYIAKSFCHDAAGCRRNVDSDPLPPEILGGDQRSPAATEGVEYNVVGIAARADDALEKCQWLLCRVAKPLHRLRIDRRNVGPDTAHRDALHLSEVTL